MKLTHLDDRGAARMVDVGDKPVQLREARATAAIFCAPATLAMVLDNNLPKGDVLAVARIAGIQAAKKTAELIPLCHSLPLERVNVEFEMKSDCIAITTSVRTSARTGVEMEALTAASVSALALYDMLKAVDKDLLIGEVRVTEKTKK